jgi:hypothetical protein
VTVNDSLRHLSDTFDRHIDTISKMNYRLFHHVADVLNARYESPILGQFSLKMFAFRREGMRPSSCRMFLPEQIANAIAGLSYFCCVTLIYFKINHLWVISGSSPIQVSC